MQIFSGGEKGESDRKPVLSNLPPPSKIPALPLKQGSIGSIGDNTYIQPSNFSIFPSAQQGSSVNSNGYAETDYDYPTPSIHPR